MCFYFLDKMAVILVLLYTTHAAHSFFFHAPHILALSEPATAMFSWQVVSLCDT